MARSWAAVLAVLAALAGAASAATVHTVITTECSPYFSWQTLGMFYSHRKSGQPGPITRIMCCTKEEYDRLPAADRDLVPTHVAPSYTRHPRNGDVYSAYNKPVAIIDWLAKNDVKEDYVLVIDADMVMREPFTPEEAGAKPGWAVAAYFGYMKGVKNALAMKHVPWVLPRNDTLAGPRGRRGDQVGGFTLMHREDLRRVAPLWLKYTEDVRFDGDAWELTGDAYSTHKGDRPWISEMYGYSYGCSASDVWHTVHHTAMLYPGYEVSEPPKVLHYGLLWKVEGTDYSFDKHWHYQFNPLTCPPWQIGSHPRESRSGLFAHPPSPRSFKTTGTALMRDLLAIEVPLTLNVAFCERHRRVCPPSDELERECSKAEALMKEYEEVFATLDIPDPCADRDIRCDKWAAAGECEKNQGFMYDSCALACKRCTPRPKPGAQAALAAAGAAGTAGGAAQAAAGQKQQAAQMTHEVADSKVKLRGGADLAAHAAELRAQQAAAAAKQRAEAAAALASRLRQRCTGHTDWSMDEVKECLGQAAQGLEYEPERRGAAAAADGQQRAAAGGGGELGQRQEQQLHEEAAALAEDEAEGEQGAGGDAGADAGAALDLRLDEGRLLGQRADGGGGGRRAPTKRLGTALEGDGEEGGEGSGLARLGLVGIFLWMGGVVLAFMLLPWARRPGRHRGGHHGLASPLRSVKGRDD